MRASYSFCINCIIMNILLEWPFLIFISPKNFIIKEGMNIRSGLVLLFAFQDNKKNSEPYSESHLKF